MSKLERLPRVGDDVHYLDDPYPPTETPGTWNAAKVVKVHEGDDAKRQGLVNLTVWDEHGNQTFRDYIRYRDVVWKEQGEGTLYVWRWPPSDT